MYTGLASLRLAVMGLGGLGGSGKVASDMARNLAKRGAKVTLLSSPAPLWGGDCDRYLRYAAVPIPRSPTPYDVRWVKPLAYAIATQIAAAQASVLSIHYAVGLVEAALLAQSYLARQDRRLKICLTLHGTDVTGFGRDPQYRVDLRRRIMACDRVTTVSHWLADQAVAALDLDERPLVVHNAVDLDLFRPQQAVLNKPKKFFTLCHVSNFRPIKRPLDAIDVLARVRQSGASAQLTMIGDGPLRKQAQDYAASKNLAQGVRFTGKLSPAALRDQLQECDAMLVTSESESFCLSALEAMACGLPVIGTRCGGMEEVISALEPALSKALLAPVGNVTVLAQQVLRLAQDTTLRQALGRRCFDTVRRCFTLDQQLRAYGDLFTEIQQGVND
jgi:N-acetyl-alpha-D-glucosaminyl L-malate synthase BshA